MPLHARESRRLAGILLVLFPSVLYGGATLLWMLTSDPAYQANELRQDLWRAGHAHAGVLLVLSLVMLHYADEAVLPRGWRWLARHGGPIAAILMPAGFFLAMPSPTAQTVSPAIYLVAAGGIILAATLFTLGIGLLRVDARRITHDARDLGELDRRSLHRRRARAWVR